MGWSSDWLYLLLFNRARDMLAEAKCAAKERSEDGPKVLLAMEYAAWNRELSMTTGDPVWLWSSGDDFSSLLDASIWQSLKKQPRNLSRSIHSIPLFSWFITEDRKQVLICRWIGPLYGNGGWWNVVGQGDSGNLIQANRRAWIS